MARRALTRRSRPNGSRAELRLWLRLLKCTNLIESRIRGLLREDFASTLPRFDMLAQLEATSAESPQGLTMSELSRRLMVSNGNLTGLTHRMVRENMVSRVTSRHDRRTQRVKLTPVGRRAFAAMARGHHAWVRAMFSGLSPAEVRQLHLLIGNLKDSVQASGLKEDRP